MCIYIYIYTYKHIDRSIYGWRTSNINNAFMYLFSCLVSSELANIAHVTNTLTDEYQIV